VDIARVLYPCRPPASTRRTKDLNIGCKARRLSHLGDAILKLSQIGPAAFLFLDTTPGTADRFMVLDMDYSILLSAEDSEVLKPSSDVPC
jgi:hypothetical protein